MVAAPSSCLMFAGPTLHRAMAMATLDLRGITVLPPVKRGDVTRLLDSDRPGTLVVVDGYFHLENLSVGHLELRTAMKLGWRVWGLSSMGAIRACEMHHIGMKGFGEIFEMYCRDPDFRDDEVALMHEPGPPYLEVTEPLVHMRRALDQLAADGVITDDHRRHIVDRLMSLWFGERTLPLLQQMALECAPGREPEIGAWTADFDRFRVKSHDLIKFLAERPWIDS